MALFSWLFGGKRSVAVLPPLAGKGVGDTVKKVVRSALSEYISKHRPGHGVMDAERTDAAYEEYCGKRSSLFEAKSAGEIGAALGAQYVCMAVLEKEGDFLYLECHLVSAKSGRSRTATERFLGINNEDVRRAAVSAAKALFSKGAVSNDDATLRLASHKKAVYLVAGSGDARKHWKNGQKTEPFDIEGFPWHRRVTAKGGSYEVGMDGKRAVLKKNGAVLYRLTDGSQAADVLSVAAHERDVYAVGWESNRMDVNIATVWKNGKVLLALNKGGRHAAACSMIVHAGDLYTAGFEQNTQGNGVATVWKNGDVLAALTNGEFYAAARSICFAGSDCYVAGYERNKADEDVTTIWKNGEVLVRLDKERQLVSDYLIFAR
jgi:hypothetical protein